MVHQMLYIQEASQKMTRREIDRILLYEIIWFIPMDSEPFFHAR